MSIEKYIRDIYSFNIISQLTNNNSYLPYTRSVLAPFTLANILNDTVVNQRRSILEFGCGISTIVLGRLLENQKQGAKLISIEHNLTWMRYIQTKLEQEELSQYVRLVHAPLSKCSFSIDENLWYDMAILNSEIGSKTFDSIIIDGPPAWDSAMALARYPAVPFIINNLCEKSVIFLDDSGREGEKTILRKWANQFNLQFEICGNTLAYTLLGDDNFDFEIL